MGIYDRDYERHGGYNGSPGYHLRGPQSATVKLVIVTAIIYVLQLISDNWLTEVGSLSSQWYLQPWRAYELLTYGFLHSPTNLWHILFNMYALWLFGRDVEAHYGPREFLSFYLVAIVVAGVLWSLSELPFGQQATMYGASGGVTAVVMLFAIHFPRRTILLMFVFPMPMWMLAVLIVGLDAMGAVNRSGSVAYAAHLGGAAFAFAYYRFGWRVSRWLPQRWKLPKLRRRPPLRVHQPADDADKDRETEVDEILRKIREHGQQSLTRRERRILEEASREYQKKRE